MPKLFEVEFVGGPLDGTCLVHTEKDYLLQLKDDPSGYYEYGEDLRYHWMPFQSNLL